jgi:hypothetical protein
MGRELLRSRCRLRLAMLANSTVQGLDAVGRWEALAVVAKLGQQSRAQEIADTGQGVKDSIVGMLPEQAPDCSSHCQTGLDGVQQGLEDGPEQALSAQDAGGPQIPGLVQMRLTGVRLRTHHLFYPIGASLSIVCNRDAARNLQAMLGKPARD